MKDKLIELRNDLYNSLPVGKIDAFELTLIISAHLKRFDEFIDSLENTSDENNKPFAIPDVSVNEVVVCPHCSADSSKMVEAAKYKCYGCGRLFYGHTER